MIAALCVGLDLGAIDRNGAQPDQSHFARCAG